MPVSQNIFSIDWFVNFAGQPATLASPIEVVGWPKPGWGARKFYRIRLLLFQDVENDCHYCATLEGTPALFSELDEVLEKKGGNELRATVEVNSLDFWQ